MPRLGVVSVSVREGRAGNPVADWLVGRARQHGRFEIDVIDLKALDLPILSEPNHPRLKKYTQPSTQAWSERVDACDAFVFVSPEYNYMTPPSLVNALDHLYQEWNYKAVALVTYGGVSGGLRGAQVTRQMVTAFKMVPIVEAVAIPFFAKLIEDERFTGGESYDRSAAAMLDELLRWTDALESLRRRSD